MELLSVKLSGYRRFAEDAGELDVHGSPIAIVGPNEVGKTSFLRALTHLNNARAFEANELTRGGAGKAEVRALFALDQDDLNEISSFGGVGRPVRFHVYSRGEDRLYAQLDPPLKRDRGRRDRVTGQLARLTTTKWFRDLADAPLAHRLTQLHRTLSAMGESASEDALNLIQVARDELSTEAGAPRSAIALIGELDDLHHHEAMPHPGDEARDRLFAKRPLFLWFDEERRHIESSFTVDVAPSQALQNLFDLIDFDLDELRGAIARNDRPRVAELTNQARRDFDQLFKGRWAQSRIRLELDVEGSAVHVFATNTGGERLIPIAERSEGLRQFIALMAFVEREAADREVIVLVDEAEQHLHYDAQADLVRVFTTQTAASKIIYTTHSAGCLPFDLGTGIRVIEATGPADKPPDEWERSRLRNWFWTKAPGYSPLLMAMGASTFAFAGTRKALLAEGPSDALLLPQLFREALDRSVLDIQVAPGLAQVGSQAINEVDFVASRVAFLVDGDAAGRAKRAELVKLGIPSAHIFVLGLGRAEVTLEDLIEKSLYIAAVNRELGLRQRPTIPAAYLPRTRRKHALEQWAKSALPRGAEDAPSERAVAHHLLQLIRDARREGRPTTLLDPRRRPMLVKLHAKIEALLAAPIHRAIERDR